MPNKKYQRGRRAEYKLMRELEEDGFSTIRAAGSHGVYDVIGFKWNNNDEMVIRLIQVKKIKKESKGKRFEGNVWDASVTEGTLYM